jgi:hypothetical protein
MSKHDGHGRRPISMAPPSHYPPPCPGAAKPKPSWWPQNPYPADLFPMEREEFAKIILDPRLRTAIAGCLGRMFWEIASDSIWEAWQREQSE